MKRATCTGLFVGCALLSGGRHAAGCDPIGKIQFICDIQAPEDFAIVPGSAWMLTSGNRPGQGAIRALHLRDKKIVPLFPSANVRTALDAKAFPACPGPIDLTDPTEKKAFRYTACTSSADPDRGCVCSSCTTARGNRSRRSMWMRRPARPH